ncbi:MAG: hypothetical protein JNG90_09440 [Planctomycetaceae bacterium]|nr:hypothetical protein [Planctomycetaceae bacterium]
MKRFGMLLVCGVALGFLGAKQQDAFWQAQYAPTRLDWLAMQCNVNHRQRYEMVHSGFVAVPPNKIEIVVKLSKEARQLDPELIKSVNQGAKEYVHGMAKAMGWTAPLEVHATDMFQ